MNKEVHYNYLEFAKCTKWVNSGSVDDAFCEVFDTSFSPTNTISGTSNTISTSIKEPAVGTTVNKCGSKTGIASGKITSTNTNFTFNGVNYTNLVTVIMKADLGDSGGIVYSYVSSSNTRYTVGIVKGVTTDFKKTYYCKANQINKALGTVRY